MPISIGFLVFPGIQLLDLAGPYDVFASLSGLTQDLIWTDLEPVLSTSGWPVQPTAKLEDCPILDVLCIPGGAGINALLQDERILDFVRARARKVGFVTSVCTGSLVLGAAGVLRGRRATTHWGSLHFLEAFGARAVEERIVEDGNLITGGGVTAGIDFALAILARLAGPEEAQLAQLKLEYAPAPPFDAGTPGTAPAEVLARARAEAAPYIERRAAIISSLS